MMFLESLLQNPFFRESKRNRMQYEYESEREPRSILQVPLEDPFFWAFITMSALLGATLVVSGSNLGRHPLFGLIVVTIFDLGRFILVPPFLPQPHFESGGWHWLVGGVIFALG